MIDLRTLLGVVAAGLLLAALVMLGDLVLRITFNVGFLYCPEECRPLLGVRALTAFLFGVAGVVLAKLTD